MNIVMLSQCADEPWRNGGGVTRTLLAWPADDAWQLRVSVAHIEAAGPFSAFPGVTRCFVVLAGPGVELAWQDQVVRLTPKSQPLAFDGGQPPHGRPLGGTTLDLNLMARSDAGVAHLERFVPGHAWQPAAHWRGLYTQESAMLEVEGREWPLPPGTLAWSDAADEPAWVLHPRTPGHAFALWLDPLPA